ncbi:hypothetical protein [Pukyongia salina]|uniref:hypothetical protein n=1 Tax=Pukyongia salina TaxID=2094025 RepID=UPI001319F3F1|nr:hypothetical protein [Pukyongia salina]
MKSNSFNICPSCIHNAYCVITHNKSDVWSCSEYEEAISKSTSPQNIPQLKNESQEMVVA